VPNGVLLLLLDVAPKANAGFDVEGEDENMELEVAFWVPLRKDCVGVGVDCDENKLEADDEKRLLLLLLLLSSEKAGWKLEEAGF
jgi:hypothetical protein